jgi:hypothetical protein
MNAAAFARADGLTESLMFRLSRERKRRAWDFIVR